VRVFVIAALVVTAVVTSARAQDAEALPSPLGLEQTLELARTRRAEILAARARARAAAQRPDIVSALEDPMIFPSLDHVPFSGDGFDWSATIEQRFPLSRVRRNRRQAAEAEAARARADAARTTLDVELEAARAFLMLAQMREMARITTEQRALAQQFLRAATARYAAGTGPQSDALRAEIELARLDGLLRSIAAQVRSAEIMLNTSLARATSAPIPPLDAKATTAEPPPEDVVRETALRARPELAGGRADVRRAEADIKVMRSMYWPMAMVRTGAARTMEEGNGWMAMLGVNIPIWRGRLNAGVAEAQAMAEMAQADLSAMRRMVEGDALSARADLVAFRERFLSLQTEVVPRARKAIDPTLAGYGSGQLPLVSVLEAAQALWMAQGDLVSAQFELGLAWARLHRAMGAERGRK
jgi:outer membrane protein TolC